jgi:hypothetical protein
MKKMGFFILLIFFIVGSYIHLTSKDQDSHVMIEDSVGSTMAAPKMPHLK